MTSPSSLSTGASPFPACTISPNTGFVDPRNSSLLFPGTASSAKRYPYPDRSAVFLALSGIPPMPPIAAPPGTKAQHGVPIAPINRPNQQNYAPCRPCRDAPRPEAQIPCSAKWEATDYTKKNVGFAIGVKFGPNDASRQCYTPRCSGFFEPRSPPSCSTNSAFRPNIPLACTQCTQCTHAPPSKLDIEECHALFYSHECTSGSHHNHTPHHPRSTSHPIEDDFLPLQCAFHQDLQHTVLINRDFLLHSETSVLRDLPTILESQDHAFLVNHYQALIPFHQFTFSSGAFRILHEPNAGGNSVNSEALSFEVLHRMYGAKLLKTEMEIIYYHPWWKKTDYLLTIDGRPLAISVTRAMKYPHPSMFTYQDAIDLLAKKLNGINISTAGMDASNPWERQVLHIWVQSERIAEMLQEVYHHLNPKLLSNTIIIATVAPNDNWLF
eukprot:gnl/Trimastix_PCT/608.p1 GENE.gnl/Trimastix_PCT/608~~gnl/Trimastix_PCT/608.p1  ORF type:complete len:440 (-),score=67.24 gnl/Trimastix_PCT/608:186-1505(-)